MTQHKINRLFPKKAKLNNKIQEKTYIAKAKKHEEKRTNTVNASTDTSTWGNQECKLSQLDLHNIEKNRLPLKT